MCAVSLQLYRFAQDVADPGEEGVGARLDVEAGGLEAGVHGDLLEVD
jgi:hypothetical protein